MFNINNQDSFTLYLKQFIRGGFIIGCLFSIFTLVNSAFEGELTIFVDNSQLHGLQGILFVIFAIPITMAFTGFIFGLVYYAIGRSIRWCLQWFV